MCDFSLQHSKSRSAAVGDKLITKDFGRGTIGFAGSEDATTMGTDATAVCVLPGTEIAFSDAPKLRHYGLWFSEENPSSKVAIFRQVDKDTLHTHHDALEFPDGRVIKLTSLRPDQEATVLQLPAKPKTEQETQDQTRLEVVA